MEIRDQVHNLVVALDEATLTVALHADSADVEDASLQAALSNMRVLRNVLEQLETV